jgi:hypothetical protein
MRTRQSLIIYILVFILVISCSFTAYAGVTVKLGFDNGASSMTCANELLFKGKIKSDKPGKVQYRFIRSDGVLQPVETVEFASAGAKDVNYRWTLKGPALAEFKGWLSLSVTYPEEAATDKVKFSLICDPKRPDLAVRIRNCPSSARPGGDIKSFRVRTFNHGGVDIKDAIVDVTLRKESVCPIPAPRAERSAHFVSGMLIQGGREKVSLKAGQKSDIKFGGAHIIPADTPLGDYFLCATIDAGDNIKESNEGNNCSCCPVKIAPSPLRPDLVIDKFSFRGWGKCEPGNPVATFEVTVKNIGNAASHAHPSKILVQVADMADRHWSNSSGLDSIPPGGTQTVVIPIYYYGTNPAHMTNVTHHSFRAMIDPHGLLDESSRKNNKSDIIYLDLNAVCGADDR